MRPNFSHNKRNKKENQGRDNHSMGPPKDDKQCRLHSYSNHVWGSCTLNPKNAGKSLADLKKSSNKKNLSEDNHMIVEIDGDDAQEAPKP
jgi:hypothetical protein